MQQGSAKRGAETLLIEMLPFHRLQEVVARLPSYRAFPINDLSSGDPSMKPPIHHNHDASFALS